MATHMTCWNKKGELKRKFCKTMSTFIPRTPSEFEKIFISQQPSSSVIEFAGNFLKNFSSHD